MTVAVETICEVVREGSSRAVTAVAEVTTFKLSVKLAVTAVAIEIIFEADREVSSRAVTAVAVVAFVKLSMRLTVEQ